MHPIANVQQKDMHPINDRHVRGYSERSTCPPLPPGRPQLKPGLARNQAARAPGKQPPPHPTANSGDLPCRLDSMPVISALASRIAARCQQVCCLRVGSTTPAAI
jgi:hypothetical protein